MILIGQGNAHLVFKSTDNNVVRLNKKQSFKKKELETKLSYQNLLLQKLFNLSPHNHSVISINSSNFPSHFEANKILFATLEENHSSFGSNSISFEIKPKWAFKSSRDLTACRFHIHSFFKFNSTPEFCPLDLFSNQYQRVEQSIRDLSCLETNNWKIFEDSSFIKFDFHKETLSKFFDSRFEDNNTSADLVSKLVGKVLFNSKILEWLKLHQKQLDPFLVGGLKQKFDEFDPSLWSSFDKTLDVFSIDWNKVLDDYINRSKSTNPASTDVLTNLMHQLHEYLISMTLKDLSILTTFSRIKDGNGSALTENLISRNVYNSEIAQGVLKLNDGSEYDYKIRLIDLKNVSHIILLIITHCTAVTPTPGPTAYDLNASLLQDSKLKHFGFIQKSKRFNEDAIVETGQENIEFPAVEINQLSKQKSSGKLKGRDDRDEVNRLNMEMDKMKTNYEQLIITNNKTFQKLEEKLQKSDSMNSQLSKEKQNFQSSIMLKEKECNDLNHKNCLLQASLEKTQKLSLNCQTQHQKTLTQTKKFEELEKSNLKLRSQLRETIEASKKDFQTAQDKFDLKSKSSSESLKKFQETIKINLEKIAGLTSENIELKEQVLFFKNSESVKVEKLELTLFELNSNNMQLDVLSKRVSHLEDELSLAKCESSSLQSQLENSKVENSNISIQLVDAKEEILREFHVVEEKSSEINAKEIEITELKEKVANLQKSLEVSTSENVVLSNSISNTSASLKGKESEILLLKEYLEASKLIANTNEAKFDFASNEIEKLNLNLISANSAKSNLENFLEISNAEVLNLRQITSKNSTEIKLKDNEIKELIHSANIAQNSLEKSISEIEMFSLSLNQTTSILTTKEIECQQLSSSLKTLEQANHNSNLSICLLNEQITEKNSAIQNLMAEIEELRQTSLLNHGAMSKELEESKREVDRLSGVLGSKINDLVSLNEDVVILESNLKVITSENAKYVAEIDSKKYELEEFAQKMLERNEEISLLKGNIGGLEGKVEEIGQIRKSLTENLSNKDAKIIEITQLMGQLEDKLETEISNWKIRVEDQIIEISNAKNLNSEISEKFDSVSEELKNSSIELTGQKELYSCLQKELEGKMEEFDQTQQSLSESLSNKDAKIIEITQLMGQLENGLETEISNLKIRVEDQIIEISNAKNLNSEISEKLDSVSEDLKNLDIELTEQKESYSCLQSELELANNMLHKEKEDNCKVVRGLELANENVSLDLLETKKMLEDVKSTLEKTNAHLNIVNDELASSNCFLDDERKKNVELQNENLKTLDLNAQMHEDNKRKNSTIIEITSTLEKLKETISQNGKEFRALYAANEGKSNLIDCLGVEKDALKKEMSEMEVDFDAKVVELERLVESQNSMIEARREEFELDIETKSIQIKSLEDRLAIESESVRGLMIEKESLSRDIGVLNEKLDKSAALLKKFQTDSDREFNNMLKNSNDLRLKISEQEKMLFEKTSEFKTSLLNFSNLEKTSNAKIDQLTTQCTTFENEIQRSKEEFKTNIETLDCKLAELKNIHATELKELRFISTENEDRLNITVESLKSDNSEKETEISKLSHSLYALTLEKGEKEAESIAKIGELKTENEYLVESNSKLSTDVFNLEGAVSQLKDSVDRSESLHAASEKAIIEKDRNILEANKELVDSREEVTRLMSSFENERLSFNVENGKLRGLINSKEIESSELTKRFTEELDSLSIEKSKNDAKLVGDIFELNNKKVNLEDELKKVVAVEKETSKLAEDLSNQVAKLSKAFEAQRDLKTLELNEMHEKLIVVTRDCKIYQEKATNLERDFTKQQSFIAILEQKNTNQRKEKDNQIKSLSSQLAKQLETMQLHKEEIENVQYVKHEKNQLSYDLEEIRKENAEISRKFNDGNHNTIKERREAKLKMDHINGERLHALAEVDRLNRELKELKDKIKKDLEKSSSEIGKLKAKESHLTSELINSASSNSEHIGHSNPNQKIKMFGQLKEENIRLKSELEAGRVESERMRKEIGDLRREVAKMSDLVPAGKPVSRAKQYHLKQQQQGSHEGLGDKENYSVINLV